VAGRTYYVYYAGQHIKNVAWFANGAGYWVANTLTLGLTNTQMLAVAEHTAPMLGVAAGSVRADARNQDVAPSTVKVVSTATSPLQVVGEVGGFLAFLSVLGGIGVLWTRHRQVAAMRRGLVLAGDRVLALEGQLARVARRGGPLVARAPAGARAGAGGALGAAGFGAPAPFPRPPGRAAAGAQASVGEGERTYSRYGGGGVPPVAVALIAAIVIAGAGVGAISLLSGTARGAVHRAHAHKALITAPIAVLNAGSVQGAAARLARSLRARHLDVLGAAHLGKPAPSSYEVLYGPGARAQARALARTLAQKQPVVAPLDPAAQAAAGPKARLVVVIP